MSKHFKKIGIFGKHRSYDIVTTLVDVINFLKQRQLEFMIEDRTASQLPPAYSQVKIGQSRETAEFADLIIVVGGDGSLLRAARFAAEANKPIVGINRGHLGFLTDISPTKIITQLDHIFNGEYQEEKRFLLHSNIETDQQQTIYSDALNDVVLFAGHTSQLIEFDITINNKFVCHYRADGIIIATPTGSTAYSLSGGGPILHPQLDAIVLVPMMPHTLSSRPIVVSGDSTIDIMISHNNTFSPMLGCDGQTRTPVAPGHHIHICKKEHLLRLLHPKDYDYYETLRFKLGWVNSNT